MNARREAEKILEVFGQRIANACAGSVVPPWFVAGMLFNESGRYNSKHPKVKAGDARAGDYNEDATRFEPGVYEDLISLRDRGFCMVSGRRMTTYNKITRADLQDLSDDAIKNLSRSYGASQIMGWSMVKMLPGTIADLRDPDRHLYLCVKRIESEMGGHIKRARAEEPQSLSDTDGEYGDALRVWNTGRAKGKTYHANYVPNGLTIMRAYRELPALRPQERVAQETLAALDEGNTEIASEVVASAMDEPTMEEDEIEMDVADDSQAVGSTLEAESRSEGAASAPAQQPQTSAVQVQQARPEPDAPEAGSVTWFKARYAALPAGVIAYLSAALAWLKSSPVNLIIALIAVGGVITLAYIVTYMWLKNRREERSDALKLQREKQAHELTLLQGKSAMSRDENTIQIVPTPIRNSDSPP